MVSPTLNNLPPHILVNQTKFWYILGSPNTPIGNQVKHTLILLSIILLSSPVIGQETGVLYLYESSSGFVLKSFGDGKVQPKYNGEIKNGTEMNTTKTETFNTSM